MSNPQNNLIAPHAGSIILIATIILWCTSNKSHQKNTDIHFMLLVVPMHSTCTCTYAKTWHVGQINTTKSSICFSQWTDWRSGHTAWPCRLDRNYYHAIGSFICVSFLWSTSGHCTPSCYQLGLVGRLQIIPSQSGYKVDAYRFPYTCRLLSFRLMCTHQTPAVDGCHRKSILKAQAV